MHGLGYFSNPCIGWCLILCRPALCDWAWFEAAGLCQIRSQGTSLFLILLVPLLCDVCVFGSESGTPACSHMLFYPSVASSTVSPLSSPYPPPAPLALLNWPSLQPSVFLHTLSLPPSCFWGHLSPSDCLSAQRLPGPSSVWWGRVVWIAFFLSSSLQSRSCVWKKDKVSARELWGVVKKCENFLPPTAV